VEDPEIVKWGKETNQPLTVMEAKDFNNSMGNS